ncbi:MAG: NUDIX hydrolase [Chloroflexi bacterium]|nr:NUDIX hydrolase [Chloroflexota bacterium]
MLQNEALTVLLIKRSDQDRWAIPGGIIGVGESLQSAAVRILEEETGMADVYVEQLYTFGEPDRDQRKRVVSVVYYALIPAQQIELKAGSGTDGAAWFNVDELPRLAFDHNEILDYALTRIRNKLEYTDVGFQLLPEEFTLTELQTAYEIVLGEHLDKRNFRRKILQANILHETGGMRTGEGRPAKLYRYRDGAFVEVKARRLFP